MKQKKDKVYIAGKVTGEVYENCLAKFEAAEQKFISKGYEVCNPTKVIPEFLSWIDAMEKLIPELAQCTHIHLLPDAYQSRGARIEACIAKQMKLIFI